MLVVEKSISRGICVRELFSPDRLVTMESKAEGSEIGAAFGLVQLKNLEDNINTRYLNFRKQEKFFHQYKEFFSTPYQNENHRTGWLAFPILINRNSPFKRKDFQIYLEKNNIQTRVVFTGNILRQPMMKGVKHKTTKEGLKISDSIMERGVLLPLHHGMTEEMFNILHENIEIFLNQYR